MLSFTVFGMTKLIRPQRGTALVEILIVIVLSSVLIGFFLHADLAVNRSIMRWTYRSGLEQAAMRVSKQIHSDLNRCDSLRLTDATEFVVFQSRKPPVRYSYRDSTITRDDRELLPAGVKLTRLAFEPLISELEVHADFAKIPTETQQVLTIVLERGEAASQTVIIPVRPYSSRHIQ